MHVFVRRILVITCVLSAASLAVACPLCSAPEQTLAEQFSLADMAVLGKWTGGQPGKGEMAGTTLYEIVDIARDPLKTLKKGDTLTLPRHRAGKPGDLCLLLATKGPMVDWTPKDVTELGYKYIVAAPPLDEPTAERLKYFVKHLESPDPTVAADAYGEFALAPYKDVVAIREHMPHEKLRQWVAAKDTPSTRLGLYGLMLGICGDSRDAEMMQERIVIATKDYRLGIEGVIAGYLLLTGEKGLEVIEQTKFKDLSVPFSEVFSARMALSFMWDYSEGRISRDRLKASMRLVLERPDMADIAIANLSRWKDWSIQDRLVEMYGEDKYSIPSFKRAVIRYLDACKKDVPKGATEKPAHALAAEKHLAELRERDPKLVKDVERFLP